MADEGKDSGSKILLIAGVAVCLLLLLGGTGAWFAMQRTLEHRQEKYAPTAPKEEEYKGEVALSEPADPWAEPAPPMQGVLVVLPFRDETGEMTYDGTNIQENILWPWLVAAPEDIGVMSYDRIGEMLWTMTPAADRYRPSPEVVRDAVAFWGGTHVVEGTIRMEGETLVVVEAKLAAPDGERTKRFEAPPRHGLVLAREINRWIVAESGWTIPDRERRVIESKAWGEEFDTTRDDRLAAMRRAPGGPEWTSALANNPDNPLLRVWRAELIDHLDNKGQLALLDAGPLPADAPAWDREIRARALVAKGEHRAARHETEILLARRPGATRYVDFALLNILEGEEDHRRRGDIAAKWGERAARCPWSDAVLAQVYHEVAWQYRGTGWANKVGKDDWHFFHTFNDKSLELSRGAIARGGPIPWVCEKLMNVYGSDGTEAEMMAILDLCAAKYPDHMGTWMVASHYLRPRWGGSHPEARALMDRAMASSGNWTMGTLCFNYCSSEAGQEFKEPIFRDRIRAFCDKYPEFDEQFRRSAAFCMENGKSREAYAHAFAISCALKDSKLRHAIAMQRPDLWNVSFDSFPNGWQSICWNRLQLNLKDGHRWREMRRLMEASKRQDDASREKLEPSHRWVNPRADEQEMLLGLAEAMSGDGAAGLERMEKANPQDTWIRFSLHMLRFREGSRVAESADEIERLRAASPDNLDWKVLQAMAMWREGRKDDALRQIDEAIAVPDSDTDESIMRWQYAVCRRIVAGEPEPDAAEEEEGPAQ